MDSRTGELYSSKLEAKKAGVPEEDLVELKGTEENVIRISEAVKADRRRKNKIAKKSRKKNR